VVCPATVELPKYHFFVTFAPSTVLLVESSLDQEASTAMAKTKKIFIGCLFKLEQYY
jgi:hypothetical protein